MAVSSEFPESDSESDADFADLKAYLSPAPPGGPSAWMESARRLDARAVAAGQMSPGEFIDAWACDPAEIHPYGDSHYSVGSLYGGEIGTRSEYGRYKSGPSAPNAEPIRVDQKKGVRGSAQHHC